MMISFESWISIRRNLNANDVNNAINIEREELPSLSNVPTKPLYCSYVRIYDLRLLVPPLAATEVQMAS